MCSDQWFILTALRKVSEKSIVMNAFVRLCLARILAQDNLQIQEHSHQMQ
jgi:hypothetical protein